MSVWTREKDERLETKIINTAGSAKNKKEEFPGIMNIMRPGNSFPRSALFLYTVCEKS
jgi:hypothetical protein